MTTSPSSSYRCGQAVWWHHTLGGGGGSGHRPNPKELLAATVITPGPKWLLVSVGPPYDRTTWVHPENVSPRDRGDDDNVPVE